MSWAKSTRDGKCIPKLQSKDRSGARAGLSTPAAVLICCARTAACALEGVEGVSEASTSCYLHDDADILGVPVQPVQYGQRCCSVAEASASAAVAAAAVVMACGEDGCLAAGYSVLASAVAAVAALAEVGLAGG